MRLRIGIALLACQVVFLPAPSSKASNDGIVLIYRGGAAGKVVFDGQVHAAKGFACTACHTDFAGTNKQLFETRKKRLISFADHDTDTKCFACHNGKAAFKDCHQCHRQALGF